MKQVGNTILAKGGNHILAKRDNSAWPKGSKLSGFSTEINWLQQKESLELTPSDLDHDYLRKLLESGLIKLSYTKEY